jgi:hypothetical protein
MSKETLKARHDNAGTILDAFLSINEYMAKALKEIKSGDKEKGYAELTVLSEKRNKAKHNYLLYVNKTIEIIKGI